MEASTTTTAAVRVSPPAGRFTSRPQHVHLQPVHPHPVTASLRLSHEAQFDRTRLDSRCQPYHLPPVPIRPDQPLLRESLSVACGRRLVCAASVATRTRHPHTHLDWARPAYRLLATARRLTWDVLETIR